MAQLHSISRVLLPLLFASVLGIGCNAIAGNEALPYVIDVEGTPTSTSACLVFDRIDISDPRISALTSSSGAPEQALLRTLRSLSNGDEEILLAQAVESPGRSPFTMREQISLYIRQMKAVEAVAIKLVFDFNGYRFFFLDFRDRRDGRIFTAPIVISTLEGKFGFVPNIPTNDLFALVNLSVRSAQSDKTSSTKSNCQKTTWEKLPYRISLVANSQARKELPLLAFFGALTDDPAHVIERQAAEHLLQRIRSAGERGNFDDLSNLMSESSWSRVRTARGTADAKILLDEIRHYHSTFYVLLGSVQIVYVRGQGVTRLLTFHQTASGIRWVNVNRFHYSSTIFSNSRGLAMASEFRPFDSARVN